MIIHITPRPLLNWILPTWHIIILTNQACLVGLIQINIWPNLNFIKQIEIIISTPHQSMGIQYPWAILSTTFPTIIFIYFFSHTTNRRTTYLEKSIKSMIQSPNDPFDRLKEKIDRMKGLMNEQIFRLSNILELTNQIDETNESWCLEDLIKIQFHRTNVNLINPNPWTNWQVLILIRLN